MSPFEESFLQLEEGKTVRDPNHWKDVMHLFWPEKERGHLADTKSCEQPPVDCPERNKVLGLTKHKELNQVNENELGRFFSRTSR